MDRYIEMGFERACAVEAIERFGDDLHAGCHWLMVRETMGHIPKRLKVTRSDNTYIGSTVRFNGGTWVIDAFDETHALVRIRIVDDIPCRWEHMSDQRIEWLTIRHERPSTVVPRASWTRCIGTLEVSSGFLGDQEMPVPMSSMLSTFIRYGRPESHSVEWEIWRAIVSLTREHVHRPSRPKPRGGYSTDVHDFRVEWMTYFHALCDVHNVLIDRFSNSLYNKTLSETVELFPESVRSDLFPKLQMWKRPSHHIQTELQKWRDDCLPVVLFRPQGVVDNKLTFTVHIHDMTFVKPREYDVGLHTQMQRLMFLLYPKTRPVHIPGPVDDKFFNNVLRGCRKTAKRTLSTPPSATFVTELMPFQRRCLNWLLERETVAETTSAWGWSTHTLEDGFSFYSSVFGYVSLTPPNTTVRGGLLAQDVGMGKTVEMLALIASNKTPGPTLVVVPTTMLAVWMSESARHVPTLRVCKFHGARRTRNMDELRAADIVFTTYRIVVNETQRHVPTIGAVRWGRIILDESHEMRNAHSATTRAVCRLFAPLRWCVSATPWPKCSQSVSSMLAFLGVAPFNDLMTSTPFFRTHQCDTPSLLCDILTNCTWWQQKRHVRLKLPGVVCNTMHIEHSCPELYQQLLMCIQHRMESDMSSPGVNHLTRRLHYIRWLRQAAIHPLLNRTSHYGFPCPQQQVRTQTNSVQNYLDTLGTTNYDESLRDLIQSWTEGNEKCSICMDAMDRPTVTPCHHMFCFECIQATYHHDPTRKCPLCRAPAGNAVLNELSVHDPVATEQVSSIWYMTEANGGTVEMDAETHERLEALTSSNGHKISTVVRLVQESAEKFVLFTQFHSAWKRVCKALTQANVQFESIEGRMTPKRREKSIRDFQTKDNVRVFVMTTKTASVGITLTAGSQVIFLEPCLDVHVRKQAIGRVWRIGQTKPVTVTTLKTTNTIDCVTDIESHLSSLTPPDDAS